MSSKRAPLPRHTPRQSRKRASLEEEEEGGTDDDERFPKKQSQAGRQAVTEEEEAAMTILELMSAISGGGAGAGGGGGGQRRRRGAKALGLQAIPDVNCAQKDSFEQEGKAPGGDSVFGQEHKRSAPPKSSRVKTEAPQSTCGAALPQERDGASSPECGVWHMPKGAQDDSSSPTQQNCGEEGKREPSGGKVAGKGGEGRRPYHCTKCGAQKKGHVCNIKSKDAETTPIPREEIAARLAARLKSGSAPSTPSCQTAPALFPTTPGQSPLCAPMQMPSCSRAGTLSHMSLHENAKRDPPRDADRGDFPRDADRGDFPREHTEREQAPQEARGEAFQQPGSGRWQAPAIQIPEVVAPLVVTVAGSSARVKADVKNEPEGDDAVGRERVSKEEGDGRVKRACLLLKLAARLERVEQSQRDSDAGRPHGDVDTETCQDSVGSCVEPQEVVSCSDSGSSPEQGDDTEAPSGQCEETVSCAEKPVIQGFYLLAPAVQTYAP